MTWLIILCCVLTVALAGTLFASYAMIESLRDEVDRERNKHEMCHEETLALLSNANVARNSAVALRAAAEKWDSQAEKPVIQKIADTQFSIDGPYSVPGLWLRYLADSLEAECDEQIAGYNMAGERVF